MDKTEQKRKQRKKLGRKKEGEKGTEKKNTSTTEVGQNHLFANRLHYMSGWLKHTLLEKPGPN